MGGPNRRRIFGDRVRGAKISAEHARERAKKAAREADAAECLLWSEQMEGFGGPAQPSPTITNHRAVPQRRIDRRDRHSQSLASSVARRAKLHRRLRGLTGVTP
jgi:hypothetical protein